MDTHSTPRDQNGLHKTSIKADVLHTYGALFVFVADQFAGLCCFGTLVAISYAFHHCGACGQSMGNGFLLVFKFLEYSSLVLGAALFLMYEWTKFKRFISHLTTGPSKSRKSEHFDDRATNDLASDDDPAVRFGTNQSKSTKLISKEIENYD